MEDFGCTARRVSLSVFAIFGFAFALAPLIPAQTGRSVSPPARRIEEMNRQSEQFERDRMNRELTGKDRKAADAKRTQEIRNQIKEDLEALQKAYNEIVINLQSGGTPERDFVLETTADIKKFAARLKENLALPKTEKDAVKENETKEELNLENRRKSLLALCRHIYNFITNPIFNEPTGLEVEQAAKAAREIDKIIEVSGKIKETTERPTN